MTKSTVTRTWIAGLVVFAGGLLIAGIGIFLMLAYGGSFTQVAGDPNAYDYTPNLSGIFWLTVGMISLGGLVVLAGWIVQFVAWIGAMVNSYLLPDKTWFTLVLIGGILSVFFGPIGLAVMIAYVVAAPDGTPYRKRQGPLAAQPGSLAPTA